MKETQNYTTVDSYKLDKTTVVRVAQIHQVLSETWNPKSELKPVEADQPHFVVAKYHSKDFSLSTHGKLELRDCELQLCEHFIGQTAEDDAMSYYLSFVDPEEFGQRELTVENFPSYKPERKYPKSQELKDQTN